jgi:hypothetical protein
MSGNESGAVETSQETVGIMANTPGMENTGSVNPPETETSGTWLDGFEQEQIGAIQNKGWESPQDLYNSYVELEKFRGVPSDQIIVKPKEGEPWDSVYSALGRPETPEEYVYNLPEGQEETPVLDAIKQAAFENGMSAAGFTNFTDTYNQLVQAVSEEQAKAEELRFQNEIEDVRREFGADLDKMTATADATALAMGFDQGVIDSLNKSLGLKGTIHVMNRIAESVGEDTVNTSAIKSQYGQTKEQMVAQKNDIMTAMKSDPKRISDYSSGIGEDYLALKRLNEALYS